MRNIVLKIYHNSVIRYIFFGGCTTLVNIGSYYLLRQISPWNILSVNAISIFLAILFAFFVNSKFVFCSQTKNFNGILAEFSKFLGARLLTMLIEIIGVELLVWSGINDVAAKIVIQFIVLTLNYIFGRFWIFRGEK